MKRTPHLDEFTRAYAACALWSSTDDDGEPLDKDRDISDIASKTLAEMKKDCEAFQRDNADDLAEYATRLAHVRHRGEGGALAWAGHDFWFTRNGHGAGFWDRGLGALGERLSKACKPYGSVDLYVGDDGKIHGN